MIRFYTQQHRYYGGIDPHARSTFIHILDASGKTGFEQDGLACPDAIRSATALFRDGFVVGVKCMTPVVVVLNREAVRQNSPGSRGFASAPWEIGQNHAPGGSASPNRLAIRNGIVPQGAPKRRPWADEFNRYAVQTLAQRGELAA